MGRRSAYDGRMLGATGWMMTAGLVWLAPGASPSLQHDHPCGLEPPEVTALASPVPLKSASSTSFAGEPAFMRRLDPASAQVQGALAGKTVYLSAGHGLVWTGSYWATQRGNTNGIVEDLVSIEAVDQYLIPYLHAMGAYVVTVREADLQTQRVIVDDTQAVLQGAAQELGTAGTGWGEVPLPITSDSVAPFAAGDSRLLAASDSESGGLVYAPEIPASGMYNVYISFVQGSDRVPDAHYVVRHSGGETHFRIDQRRHGSTWVLLGRFHFEAGAGSEAASVAVLDDSVEPGGVISTDAVRFGGGMTVHDRGGGENGRPLYEQAARYYTQYSGAPPSVFAAFDSDGTSDVSTRSRFSAWEHEAGEDAVYVAWHSNAPNPSVGTSSYTYGSSAPPGPLSNFSGVAGSRELQDFIHFEMIDDLRAGWDPEWTDQGRFTAYFGEVNPSHNPEMPAVLLEVAYHDTPSDAQQLRDPGFRRIVSRAIAQGIARYFADADGVPLVLPPEPPTAIWVTQAGGDALSVSWLPPDPEPGSGDDATRWLVQVSTNGEGFDDGTLSPEPTFTLTGLQAEDVRFFRIVAVNEGGRSLPSQVVGAAVAPSGEATALVVGGFDRLDGGLLLPEDLSAFSLATVDRMWLHRMNDGGYARRHGLAIAEAGFSFDGATDDAVELAALTLDAYQAVDWFTGEDSVGDEPLSALARDAITDYLEGGGRLLVSGAELGWALDEFGTPDEQAFFYEQLRARYLLDDAETYDVAAQGALFEGLEPSFYDPTVYDPRYPDVLEPEGDAQIVLAYQGGSGVGAGLAFGIDQPGARGVVLGFPFETVADADTRTEMMIRILDFFEVQEGPPLEGGTTGGSDETSSGTGDSSGDGDTGDASGGTTGDAMMTDTDTPTAHGDDSGCGCRADRRAPSSAWWLVLALGLTTRRRQRDGHVQ